MEAGKPGRGRIYNSITETIGDTPLVRMARMPKEAGVKADILLKLEFFNPISSVKDRIGVVDDRGAGEAGHHHAGQVDAGRTDQRQHRHRARLRRRGQGLQAHPRHAGIDVDRAAQDAAAHGRRGRAHRSGEGHEGRHRARRRRSSRRRPARSSRSNSRIPPTRTSIAAPRRRKSGTTPTARSTSSSPASAPAARSPASARC